MIAFAVTFENLYIKKNLELILKVRSTVLHLKCVIINKQAVLEIGNTVINLKAATSNVSQSKCQIYNMHSFSKSKVVETRLCSFMEVKISLM